MVYYVNCIFAKLNSLKKKLKRSLKIRIKRKLKMDFQDSLDEFKCALSEDKHFIIQPIPLIKCGHAACKECFSSNAENNRIKCKICNIVSDFDYETASVSIVLNKSIQMYHRDMLEIVEKDTITKLNYLKSIL